MRDPSDQLLTDVPLDSVPPWLLPVSPLRLPVTKANEILFENMFDAVMDRVARGEPLSRIITEDPRGLSYPQFRRWIDKDPERKQTFEEVKKYYMEVLEDERLIISDGKENPMEDIERTKVRIKTRTDTMAAWNERYGKADKLENSKPSINVIINQPDGPSRTVTIDGEAIP